MTRKYVKLPIAVRRASMEGRCANRHSGYAFNQGYVYCPWCGLELRFELHCDKCGKNFNSVAAYAAHLDEEFISARPLCPVSSSHTVHLRRHRGVIFCDYCQKEYPLARRGGGLRRQLKGTSPTDVKLGGQGGK